MSEPTEQDAFLSAVVANPDDEVARLAYADWLDDRGWDGTTLRMSGTLTIHNNEILWVLDKHIFAAKLGRVSEMPVCQGPAHFRHEEETRRWVNGGWLCRRCGFVGGTPRVTPRLEPDEEEEIVSSLQPTDRPTSSGRAS